MLYHAVMEAVFTLFSAAMSALPLKPGTKIALAVSGGGDSMGMAVLMEKWVKSHGGTLLALTVDHGLRPEAKKESADVAAFFASRGITHKTLTWQGEKPTTRIQERARRARYDLLLDACRAEGAEVLALAHNLEDQTETFWMRLAHGSGLDGLAAMPPYRMQDGIMLIRPLLQASRAQLRDFCRVENIPYIDDPSNADGRYLRVKLRAFEELLETEGFTASRLAGTMEKLSAAREALQWMTDRVFDQAVAAQDETLRLDKPVWLDAPREIRLRVLSRLIRQLQPREYAVEHAALERLCDDVARHDFSGCTLGGCLFAPRAKGKILVKREEVLTAVQLEKEKKLAARK